MKTILSLLLIGNLTSVCEANPKKDGIDFGSNPTSKTSSTRGSFEIKAQKDLRKSADKKTEKSFNRNPVVKEKRSISEVMNEYVTNGDLQESKMFDYFLNLGWKDSAEASFSPHEFLKNLKKEVEEKNSERTTEELEVIQLLYPEKKNVRGAISKNISESEKKQIDIKSLSDEIFNEFPKNFRNPSTENKILDMFYKNEKNSLSISKKILKNYADDSENYLKKLIAYKKSRGHSHR